MRIAKGSGLAAAGLAFALAGCAGAPQPPTPFGPPDPCDLICHILKLFEKDEPAPVPVASPAPPAAPKRRPAVRSASAATRRNGPPKRRAHDDALTLRKDSTPAEMPPDTTVVPQDTTAQPAPLLPDGEPPPEESRLDRTMDGSIAIAPPWFEPWPAQ